MTRIPSRRIAFAASVVCLALLLGPSCRSRAPKDAVAAWRGGFITRPEAERFLASLGGRGLHTQSEISIRSGVEETLSELAFQKIAAAEAGDPKPQHRVLHLDARGVALVQYYVERKGKRTYEVPDEDALAIYKAHLDRYTVPEGCIFRHVFLRADRHSKEELARLEAVVLDKLARGTPIAQLAGTYSESETARRQGTVGPVFRGQMDAKFEEQLYRLSPGRTAVIRTPQGTHVVEVTEKRPARTMAFEEVKQQIVHVIMDKKSEAEREQLMAALRSRYGVVDRTADPKLSLDEVALRVKDRELTRRELDEYLFPRLRQRGSSASGVRQQLVHELVQSDLLYLDAVESGLDREQGFIDRWELRELRIRSRAGIERRLQKETPTFSDDVILRYFREHHGSFVAPPRFQASYIYMPFGSAHPFDLERKMEELEKVATAPGADPAEVARRCTEAGAVFVDMGWATSMDAARVTPEFQRRILAQTSPGSTGVFKDDAGLFVILVRTSEPRRPMVDPADRPAIRERYVELRRDEILHGIKERELKERGFKILATDVFKKTDGNV